MTAVTAPAAPPAPVDVLSKAAVRAAGHLGVRQNELAEILGVSPAAVSRAVHGGRLPDGAKTLELATLFVRVFRSLDAIVGGEDAVAAKWLRSPNDALGAPPIERIKTVQGLVGVLAYLDARRAIV